MCMETFCLPLITNYNFNFFQVKSSDEAKILCMTTIGNILLKNKDFENVKVCKTVHLHGVLSWTDYYSDFF